MAQALEVDRRIGRFTPGSRSSTHRLHGRVDFGNMPILPPSDVALNPATRCNPGFANPLENVDPTDISQASRGQVEFARLRNCNWLRELGSARSRNLNLLRCVAEIESVRDRA